MTTIRTFIAIDLSEEVRAAVIDLQNRLKSIAPPHTVRWSAPQTIHLTLHFLGDTEAEQVDSVAEALTETSGRIAPFDLALGQLGCFPNLRRPKVIWVGVLGNTNSLQTLHRQLGAALAEAIGFEPDNRPYAPHLTLGRLRRGVPSRHIQQLSQMLQTEQAVGKLATLTVTEISLIKSELKAAGPIYTTLHQAQLAG